MADDINRSLAALSDTEAQLKKSIDDRTKLTKDLTVTVSNLSTLDRVSKVLGAFQTSDALYKMLDENKKNKQKTDILLNYMKGVGKDLGDAATGTTSRGDKKSFANIMTDFYGWQDNFATKAIGLGLDITTDPAMYFKPISLAVKGMKAAGVAMSTIAPKIPAMAKAMDTIGRHFDVYHDLAKTLDTASLKKFQDAVRIGIHAKDYSALKQFGVAGKIDMSSNALGKTVFPPNIAETVKHIFSKPEIPGGILGKGLDMAAQFQRLRLLVSPTWYTRNAVEGVGKAAMAGATPMDFARSLHYGITKPPAWQELSKRGVASFAGESEKAGFAALIANFIETHLGRGPVAAKMLRQGKSTQEIVEATNKIFYELTGAKQLTKTERVLRMADPYYGFDKGQLGFWPGAVSKYSQQLTAADYVRRGTRAPYESNPNLRPNETRFAGVGGWGFSHDDALKLLTGDMRTWMGRLNQAITVPIQALANYSVGKQSKISDDTTGYKYRNMDPVSQSIVGYNGFSQTTQNPMAKMFLEAIGGGPFSTILNASSAYDKGGLKNAMLTSLFSVHPVSEGSQRYQSRMNPPSGGNILSLFGGMGSANAGNQKMSPQEFTKLTGISPTSLANEGRVNTIKEWGTGMKLPVGMDVNDAWKTMPFSFNPNDSPRMAGYNFSRRTTGDLENIYKMGISANPRVNFKAYAGQKSLNMTTDALMGGHPEYVPLITSALAGFQNALGPKGKGQYYLTEDQLRSTKVSGAGGPVDQMFLKEQQNLTMFKSKSVKLMESHQIKDSVEYITNFIKTQTDVLDTMAGMSRTKYNDRTIKQAQTNLEGVKASMLKSLGMKFDKAQANTMKLYVESIPDSIEKLEMEREAAIKEFTSSEEGLMLSEAKGKEAYNQRINVIKDKFGFKIQEYRAKLAKTIAEALATTGKYAMEGSIEALDTLYKRGGVSIPEYYKQQKGTALSQLQSGGSGLVGSFASYVKDDKVAPRFMAIAEDLKKSEVVGDYDKALQQMQKILASGTIKAEDAATLIKEFAAAIQGYRKKLEGFKQGEFSDTQMLARAKMEVSMGLQKANLDYLAATSKGKSFYTPWAGKDWGTAQDKINQGQRNMFNDQTKIGALKFASQVPGAKLDPRRDEENDLAYADRVSAQLAKVDGMREYYAGREKERGAMIYTQEQQLTAQRVALATTCAQNLVQAGEMLYQASGQQSREFFYLWKSMALAQAMITAPEAVMNAYNQGLKFGGPTFAFALAGTTAAMMGVQIGIIAGQMMHGSGKAKGGPIKGGSGTRDDVPIMAMAGEFFIQKSAAQKYGYSFLDALNNGSLEFGSMSLPSIPVNTTGQTTFATGGKVSAIEASTPFKIVVKNEGSLPPVAVTKARPSMTDQEYVVTLFLDAKNRNVGGLRDQLGG